MNLAHRGLGDEVEDVAAAATEAHDRNSVALELRTLFPWVVSDFGLMDAIESGTVKIPRVPVADDSMTGEQPTFRDLWIRIRENLPRRGIKDSGTPEGAPIPKELEAALISLYGDYARHHAQWSEANMGRPPVFIVVCSNTPSTTPAGLAHAVLTPPPRAPRRARPAGRSGRWTAQGRGAGRHPTAPVSPVAWLASWLPRRGRSPRCRARGPLEHRTRAGAHRHRRVSVPAEAACRPWARP